MARFFINRPIVAIVIAILTVLGGLIAMLGLPVAQFPDIVPPLIQIQTSYPGADALTIEQSVATPIEQQMNGVEDMLYLQSVNANDGTITVRVTFDVGTDRNADQVNAQNRVAQALPSIPVEVNQFGLTYRKTQGTPLVLISLYSPKGSYDGLFLGNYALINVNDALYRVNGVGQVLNFGAAEYAMRIWIHPDQLAKLGLTVADLTRAVQQQSTVNPAGQVGAEPAPKGQEFTYAVRSQGRLLTPEQFAKIVVRLNPDGSAVRLGDVARIELGALTYKQIGRMNGKAASIIGIYQAPGSNALAVSKAIRRAMEELKQRFPEDIDYAVSVDTTAPVTEGIREIVITLGEAMLLVLLVVFLFLQNWRATLIPLVAVPVSLIGTFAVFPLLGFSINTLSLFGLVLAIGLVVDDAIVVVEAVERHIEEGMTPRDATLQAMREVSGPVVAIALILSSVFLPVAFLGGIQGRLNKQFAVTIAISVLISAFNALSLAPALSALLLRPRAVSKGLFARFFGGFNRAFERATRGYVSLSSHLVRRSVIALLILGGFAVLAGGLGKKIPGSFVPEEDQGYFYLNVQLPDAASLQRTDEVCRKVEKILAETKGVKYYNTVAGFSLLSYVSATYNGFYFVSLQPWHDRDRYGLDARTLIDRLNKRFRSEIPEGAVFGFMPPAIPGLGASGGFSLWLQDRTGGTVEFLNDNLQKFLEAARRRPEIGSVNSTFRAAVPQVFVDVDRDKALKQGVPVADVYQSLQTFLGGTYVNQFNRFGRQWRVFMQADAPDRVKPEDIGSFYVRNAQGSMVPLSALTTIRQTAGPEYTQRFNLYRAAQVTGSAAAGYSSGQAMAALERVAAQTLPREIGTDWSDLSYQEKKASGTTGRIFALSLVFVFLILAALYESWSLPLSVLLSVPVAVVGGFLGLFLRHYDFDVYGQIGLIVLIGLAAKNAILIVEFAKTKLENGKDLVEAALQGAQIRLRPILMTSFAFILGCVPLWIAQGAGAASRRILGTVVVAGMLAATCLAIFLIPVLFVVVERRLGSMRGKTRPAPVLAFVLVAAGTLGGCAVGPNYRRPALPAPETFYGSAVAASDASFADARWWDVFADPVLRSLVEESLRNGYDVRLAAARVEESRARYGIAGSLLYPVLGYSAGAGRSHTSTYATPSDATGNLVAANASVSWELDVWGRVRRLDEAARAQYLATEEGRRAVVLSLVADVASAYFDLRDLDAELEISRRTRATFQDTYDLFGRRLAGGAASALETARAEALLANASAQIPVLEQRVVARENQITLLLGRPPGPVPRGAALTEQPMPPVVPAGLPSALLLRRPDLRAAEQSLVAANASVGVARAAFYPTLSLTGLFGGQSTGLSDLFAAGRAWSISANLLGPLFQGGRLRAEERVARARFEEALVTYEQAFTRALGEVSNSLVAIEKLAREETERERSVRATREAVRLATLRYESGLSAYFEVLDALQLLLPAETALVQTRRDRLTAFVSFYRALGGGWSDVPPPPPSASPGGAEEPRAGSSAHL